MRYQYKFQTNKQDAQTLEVQVPCGTDSSVARGAPICQGQVLVLTFTHLSQGNPPTVLHLPSIIPGELGQHLPWLATLVM